MTFFTIGHSTRTLTELVELLRSAAVDLLVDVRSLPRSRTNPQFNRETLPAALAQHGIGYCHLAALGGLRGRGHEASASLNDYWDNPSFRRYADYAQTRSFQLGLQHLLELGHERTCAIMCAETLWWRCHRRIIADYLMAAGEQVVHILGAGKLEPAHLHPAARIAADGSLIYPRSASDQAASPRAGQGDGR